MTHPNRVQPDGTFLATPARGTLTGNRGVLHDARGTIGPARWKHRAWISCELSFRGRHRPIMPPGRWTALFFLDEAVAMAAGHRPCGECRRDDYRAFAGAWVRAHGIWPGPREADAILHAARAIPGARRLRSHRAGAASLPDGAIFRTISGFALAWQGQAFPGTPYGYERPAPLPAGPVEVLTSLPMLDVLRAGYAPRLHPSAA